MTGIGALVLLTPILAVWSYRRSGARWPAVGGYVALAVVLLLGGAALSLFYVYVIDISAGLCGDSPLAAASAGALAYATVASWAARRPSRVWAWPFAVGAAAAAGVLVSYFFSSAHGYCET